MSNKNQSGRKLRAIVPRPEMVIPKPKRGQQSITEAVSEEAMANSFEQTGKSVANEEHTSVNKKSLTTTDGDMEDDIDFTNSGMAADMRKHRGVFVSLALGKPLCRDGTEMLILPQLIYWFGESETGHLRAQIIWDGYFWVAKTYLELAYETGLEERQVRHAVSKLVKRGVIFKQIGLFKGVRTCFLRIRTSAVSKAMDDAGSQ